MKRFSILLILFLILSFVVPNSVAFAADNGVDDLRGRWDFRLMSGEPLGFLGNNPEVMLFINDVRPGSLPDTYLAGGCMRSPKSDAFMPLSLRAVYNPVSNSYNLIIYSTIIPAVPGMEPFLIRFNGDTWIHGEGVKDDDAEGKWFSEVAEGEWIAEHHDRRQTKCPAVDGSTLGVQADLWVNMDLGDVEPDYTLYGLGTVIVSSGLQVVRPDGFTFVVQEYTDIFSPDVDFIGRFRFLDNFAELPHAGTYQFVLLDIFGEPIPGTESTDEWHGCMTNAPTNLNTSPGTGSNINLAWDGVSIVPDSFDPVNEIGFYQIGVSPFNWEGVTDYGANWISSNFHELPWETFEPGSTGFPEGNDFGISLANLADGLYKVDVGAFSYAAPEFRDAEDFECSVYDYSQILIMTKEGNSVNFEQVSLISGRITDELDNPLANIDVGACDYDNPDGGFCSGAQTDADGFYSIPVISGAYRIGAHPESGYLHEFFDDSFNWDMAERVEATSGNVTGGIDFQLAEAGTISGIVTDLDGNPLEGIDVSACDYDNPETGFCNGYRTEKDGMYWIQVPTGTFRVGAHPESGYLHEFYNDQTNWDMADPVAAAAGAETGGIDFALEQGYPISGYVYDGEGNPLGGIGVDIVEGGYGTCTDENGFYELTLPLGVHDIAAGRMLCGEHPFGEQVVEAVPTGSTNIDFHLVELGPPITGHVFNIEGYPLGGIGVDIVEGGYGTCTDENGYYELRLPEGTYDIAAGRYVCGEHPFEEAIQEGIATGTGDVDFYLNEQFVYNPTLHVVPAHPEIHGHEWNLGIAVTIFVDNDDDLDNGILYTDSRIFTDDPLCEQPYCGQPYFDVSEIPELPDGILPGYVVTMTDGEATRVVHVTYLVWEGVDLDADTVFGHADPDAWVEVQVHGEIFTMRMVQADGAGFWEANFSTPGPREDEQVIADLVPGTGGRAIQFEGGEPDDGTLAYWGTEPSATGQISGHVYDADNVPLAGIGVTTADNVYSTCTDEFGYYELTGLPEGMYAVVAGRFQCGDVPQYEEQVMEEIPTGATDADFHLNLVHVIQITAFPDGNAISSFGWVEGDEITLQIDENPSAGDGPELTRFLTAGPGGMIDTGPLDPFILAPGHEIFITNGTFSDTLVVAPITLDTFDATTMLLGGTAPAGVEVGVGVLQDGYEYWMVVTADGSGNWEADFSGDSTPMIGVFDVHAMVWDEDGDFTQVNYHLE